MNHINRDGLIIRFFGKDQEISMEDIKLSRFSERLRQMVQGVGISRFVVLDQVHGNVGFCVNDDLLKDDESWFEHQGDFIITDYKNCALVILTADCLPLIFYDPCKQVIAAVHSGWKGTSLSIAELALSTMQKKYGSALSDIECFLGPSAGSCCYDVTSEFVDHFKIFDYGSDAWTQRDGKLFFDNAFMVHESLKKVGIKPEKIYTTKEKCTICDLRFSSFRRDKEHSGRQVTLVALREVHMK